MSSKDDYLRNGGPVFESNPAEIDKNPDGLKPDNTDLKRTTKKTLKDYLSDKTSINQFPVDKRHDENKPDTTIYGDSEGKTTPELKINEPDANEYQFKPQFLQKQKEIVRFSPGKINDKEDIDAGLKFNGNNLLNYNKSDLPSSEINFYRNRKLSVNRFSDNSEYGSNIGDKTFSIKKRTKDRNEADKHVDLSVDQLSEIASYLMLRASGKKGAKPGELSMFVPGIQQVSPGAKIDGNQFNINQTIKDIFLNEEDKDILGKESGQYRDSYGVLNNYFDKFEKTSVGTLALSAAIVVATNAAVLTAALPYSLLVTDREIALDYNAKKTKLEPNRKGVLNQPNSIIPTFEFITGIERSRFKEDRTYFLSFYLDILNGGSIFFSPNGISPRSIGSLGYYVVFCRSIISDTFRIIDLFNKKKGESDLEYADNIVSFETLQIIKNSKLIKCINLFIKLSDLDKDSNRPYAKDLSYLQLQQFSTNINPDNAKSLEHEDEINSNDKLPFYFKDLRDNKIIQFDATLSDFSETYSPQWVEEHYYGRVDPVKFYKSTNRKVSINFKVVSYSEDDYAKMWDNLQELTSLVYPTYTNKREITAGDMSYEVPFSQTFKSQPLIRVKIGDLITNNISKNGSGVQPGDFIGSRIFTTEAIKLNTLNPYSLIDLYDINKIKGYLLPDIKSIRYKKLRELQTNICEISRKSGTYSKKQTQKILAPDYGIAYAVPEMPLIKKSFTQTRLLDISKIKEYETLISLFKGGHIQLSRNDNNEPFLESKIEELGGEIKSGKFGGEYDIKEFKHHDIGSELTLKTKFVFDKPLDDIDEIYLTDDYYFLIKSQKLIKAYKDELIKQLTDKIPRPEDLARVNYTQEGREQSRQANTFIVEQNIKNDWYFKIKFVIGQDSDTLSLKHNDVDILFNENSNKSNFDLDNNPFYLAMKKTYGLGALAYVDNLSYKTQEGYPWETSKDKSRRPKIIDVSMELTILHDIQPFSKNNYKHRNGK